MPIGIAYSAHAHFKKFKKENSCSPNYFVATPAVLHTGHSIEISLPLVKSSHSVGFSLTFAEQPGH